MSVQEPQPGRQCRSVSFDDGKRRVIATDLDPEVEPLALKTSVGRPPTPRPRLTDATPLRRPTASVLPMAMHEPYPGRQWRSVTFDDAKRRVIATDQDAEVDTLNLKSIIGRPPTLRPSRTDCC
ncbi:uncharacterized protein LOC144098623 [Amblyomma americanum]